MGKQEGEDVIGPLGELGGVPPAEAGSDDLEHGADSSGQDLVGELRIFRLAPIEPPQVGFEYPALDDAEGWRAMIAFTVAPRQAALSGKSP